MATLLLQFPIVTLRKYLMCLPYFHVALAKSLSLCCNHTLFLHVNRFSGSYMVQKHETYIR